RRLRGCQVSDRRRVRRFIRPLRPPIGLVEIAAAGLDLTPGPLITALSGAVDPAWTDGHSFAVRYSVHGEGGQCVRVEARDGRALRVIVEAEPRETAEAEAGDGVDTIVTVKRTALISLLA